MYVKVKCAASSSKTNFLRTSQVVFIDKLHTVFCLKKVFLETCLICIISDTIKTIGNFFKIRKPICKEISKIRPYIIM